MKAFQRILAVLLCLVMSLGMISMVASAESIITGSEGSITIHKYELNGDKGNHAPGTIVTELPEGAVALEGVTFVAYQIVNGTDLKAYYDGTADDETEAKITAAVADSTKLYTVTNGTYNVTPISSETVDPVTKKTDGNGEAKFTSLPLGLYLIIETEAPAKVVDKQDPFLVSLPMTVENQWLYNIHVYPKNSTSVNTVSLKKIGNNNEAIEGVQFTLTKLDADNTWVDITKTTDTYGVINFNTLTHGTYQLVENSAPTGYIVDRRPIEFSIAAADSADGQVKKGEVTLKNEYEHANVVAKKNDNEEVIGYEIVITNEKPDLSKEITQVNGTAVTGNNVKQTDVSVGDIVTYKATIYVPENIALLNEFTVTDTPVNLEFQSVSSVYSVTDGATMEAEYYNCVKSGNGFEFKFNENAEASVAGDTIEITYTAKVLDTAAAAISVPNTVELTYSNEILVTGTPGSNTIKDSAIVYTYALEINKYGKEAKEGNELSGVKFKLYTTQSGGTALKFVKQDGYYVLSKAENASDELETVNGKITIKGLDNGTYYLEETETVGNYNLLSSRVAVNVAIASSTTWTTTITTTTNNPGVADAVKTVYAETVTTTHTGDDPDTDAMVSIDVINKEGFNLPATGGIGTLMFIIIGGVLMAGGICLIVPNKKRAI